MAEFSVSSFIGEIIMKVNNEMSDFIRQKVCETDPCLIQYDFNIDKIADAINKQIPKKPVWDDTYFLCPTCGKKIHYSDYRNVPACRECHQILDWSEKI